MKIIVVGGGISGLTLAYQLIEEGISPDDLTLFETNSKVGGKICSIGSDGFTVEGGPNGFLDSKPETLELCKKIGLSDELLPSSDSARKRYIYSENNLHRLPENPVSFLKSELISWSGKVRLGMEPFIKKGLFKNESLADFAKRRLGYEAYQKLIDPMVSGVFAGNPEVMSLKSSFPRIWELENEYGSLVRAMIKLGMKKKKERTGASPAGPAGKLTSFSPGLNTLTDKLKDFLGDIVKTDSEVTEIKQLENGWEVKTKAGESQQADKLVLAIPSYRAADLIKPVSNDLSEVLHKIIYSPVAVFGFGYDRESINHDLDGFGYLVPSREKSDILGCLWTSSIFPGSRTPENKILLRVLLGGARNPNMMDTTIEELEEKAKNMLRTQMGINTEPSYKTSIKWYKAIPQYRVGHQNTLENIDLKLNKLSGLYLGGNAYHGISLPDCVKNSINLAKKIIS